MKRISSAVLIALATLILSGQAALAAGPGPSPTAQPATQATAQPSPTPPPAAATSAPAAVAPAPTPSPPAPPAKKIVVSLNQQKLFAYENDQVVGQTVVTTGGPRTGTPMGTFSVLEKRTNWNMTSPWPEDDWRWYAPSWVNYGLLFEASGFFIHDAPWRHNFGPGSNAQYGTPGGDFTGTHGCVNVPLPFEHDLSNWANIGTPVIIQP
ncbi:MAG TPA: L,D-transpeptidase [Chloroflexota bacterium]|nr:L,D-transpeptidase [Chloroflexota bacterium]